MTTGTAVPGTLKSAELRDLVGERDGWECRFCARPVIPPPTGRNHTAAEAQTLATLDHWVPRARGGTWDLANLVMACRPCNNDKGTLTGPEYLAVLAYRHAGHSTRRRAVRCPHPSLSRAASHHLSAPAAVPVPDNGCTGRADGPALSGAPATHRPARPVPLVRDRATRSAPPGQDRNAVHGPRTSGQDQMPPGQRARGTDQ